MLSRCFLEFSVGVGDFVIGLSQIPSFFSLKAHFSYSGVPTYDFRVMKPVVNILY